MAAWSSLTLKNICKINGVGPILFKSANTMANKGLNYVPARCSSNTISIRASRHAYIKIKDLGNLYMLVGIIPVGAIIMYMNLFIGPATLAVAPEGYVPKYWEYHKNPVSRFLARYVCPNPQEIYERNMHNIFVEHEKIKMRQLEKKVKNLIRERQDYQAWYFQKYYSKYDKLFTENVEEYNFDGKGQKHGVLSSSYI